MLEKIVYSDFVYIKYISILKKYLYVCICVYYIDTNLINKCSNSGLFRI